MLLFGGVCVRVRSFTCWISPSCHAIVEVGRVLLDSDHSKHVTLWVAEGEDSRDTAVAQC